MSGTEEGSFYNSKFAGFAAIVLCLLGIGVIWWWLMDGMHAGLSDADWDALDARTKLAGAITIPVVIFGAVTLLVGVWMAVVEWRGILKTPKTTLATMSGSSVDLGKIIEAIGKLKGAALAMVVGGLLLLGAAWVAQSAAQPPAAPASSTAGPTGSTGG